MAWLTQIPPSWRTLAGSLALFACLRSATAAPAQATSSPPPRKVDVGVGLTLGYPNTLAVTLALRMPHNVELDTEFGTQLTEPSFGVTVRTLGQVSSRGAWRFMAGASGLVFFGTDAGSGWRFLGLGPAGALAYQFQRGAKRFELRADAAFLVGRCNDGCFDSSEAKDTAGIFAGSVGLARWF